MCVRVGVGVYEHETSLSRCDGFCRPMGVKKKKSDHSRLAFGQKSPVGPKIFSPGLKFRFEFFNIQLSLFKALGLCKLENSIAVREELTARLASMCTHRGSQRSGPQKQPNSNVKYG